MAPTTYSGALQPKKKSELIEIALALRLSDQGTKDEIQARIKRHLDNNQDALEDDPVFAGLFGRRKRSLQPQPIPSRCPIFLFSFASRLSFSSGRFAPPVVDAIEKPRSSTGRRVAGLDPIKESTPPKDLRDVSTFLKHPPFSPPESTPTNSPRPADVETPSSLPPPPPSPIKAIIEHMPSMPSPSKMKDVVKVKQQEVMDNGYELLASLRLVSNSVYTIYIPYVQTLCIVSVKFPECLVSFGCLRVTLYYLSHCSLEICTGMRSLEVFLAQLITLYRYPFRLKATQDSHSLSYILP